MNREIFPGGLYPLQGDVTSTAGSNKAIVTGIQNVPVDTTAPTVAGELLTYSGVQWTHQLPSNILEVVQTAHGFSNGQAVYFDGSVWGLAEANSSSTLGLAVVTVIDVDTFLAYLSGSISGLSGLTTGQYYFVSDSVAGQLTSTEPVALTSYSNPLLFALSATSGVVLPFRPSKVAAPIKFAVTIGDGTNTTYTITHNLGTTDLLAQVIELTGSLSFAYPQINIVDANNISVVFSTAPALNSYRVVIEV